MEIIHGTQGISPSCSTSKIHFEGSYFIWSVVSLELEDLFLNLKYKFAKKLFTASKCFCSVFWFTLIATLIDANYFLSAFTFYRPSIDASIHWYIRTWKCSQDIWGVRISSARMCESIFFGENLANWALFHSTGQPSNKVHPAKFKRDQLWQTWWPDKSSNIQNHAIPRNTTLLNKRFNLGSQTYLVTRYIKYKSSHPTPELNCTWKPPGRRFWTWKITFDLENSTPPDDVPVDWEGISHTQGTVYLK